MRVVAGGEARETGLVAGINFMFIWIIKVKFNIIVVKKQIFINLPRLVAPPFPLPLCLLSSWGQSRPFELSAADADAEAVFCSYRSISFRFDDWYFVPGIFFILLVFKQINFFAPYRVRWRVSYYPGKANERALHDGKCQTHSEICQINPTVGVVFQIRIIIIFCAPHLYSIC